MTTHAAHFNASNNHKVKTAILWTLQVLGAAMFIMAGANKLMGNPMMVQMYETIGIGQWFRYLTGVIEVGGAVLLLIPSLSGVGALLLAGTMVGAILTHLFVIGGSPLIPAVLLLAMLAIAYGRKDRTLRLINKK